MALGGRGGITQALMEQQGLVAPVDVPDPNNPQGYYGPGDTGQQFTPQERIEQGFEDLPPPSELPASSNNSRHHLGSRREAAIISPSRRLISTSAAAPA